MDRLLEKLWIHIRQDVQVPFQITLFRLICLSVALLLIFLILPANLLQNLPPLLNLSILVFSIILLYLHRASRQGRHYIKTFYILGLLMLNIAWILDAGSDGSINYFFFSLSLYPLIFFRGHTRWLLILLLVLNNIALLVAEHFFPQMVVPFNNPMDRLLDLFTGFFFCEFVCVMLFWIMMTKHEHELDERMRAEEELRRSKSLFDSIITGSSDAIFAKDTSGRYLLFNDAAARMTGKNAADVIGKDDFAIFSPEHARWIVEDDRDVLTTGKELVYERELATASGRCMLILCTKGPLRNGNGDVTGLYGISRDVSEIREAQKTLAAEKAFYLEELNIALEQRVRDTVTELRDKDQLLIQQSRLAAMGEMIGNIAHQWRQPLNNLGLMVQQLKIFHEMGELDGGLIESNVAKSMQVIQHMSKTINDFSDFFKPDKTRAEFSVAAVIHRTVKLLEVGLNAQSINIRIDEMNDSLAWGFENEYAQVVLIIVQNARDAFVDRKIAAPQVDIAVSSQNGHAVATFADNAGGIPEEIIDKIFDPYFSTKHKSESTGIGLFMSKRIIEHNMRGTLSVRNTDHGAEFTIAIPHPSGKQGRNDQQASVA